MKELGEILEEFLGEMGIELLYTPIYSPDLNPAENAFSNGKNVLNYDLLPLVNYDIKIVINEAINTITSLDMHTAKNAFFKLCNCNTKYAYRRFFTPYFASEYISTR